MLVKMATRFPALFYSHADWRASKCAKIKDNRMQTEISIRLFRLSDMGRVLQIEHACFRRDAYDRKLFADFFHKCGDLFLVAVRRGRVCGYMLACTSGNPPDRAEIVSIAVDRAERGKGVATALMASTIRRIRRRGVVRFWLTVKVTNRVAIRFYEGYGFDKERIVRAYYEDGKDGWRMAKAWD